MSTAAKPRVALESAVITHGLPRPRNLEVARKCEQAVRDAGAEPATIAIFEGRVVVGLSEDELHDLARDERSRKCAVQDIGVLLASGVSAGTTVSATLAIAASAGLAVMSTGGIGGVHFGDFDISTDLVQLTRSAVTVVCSGAKSILDIPATVQALETLGVPVIGYGTQDFPGFFFADTGEQLAHRLDTAADVARAIKAYRSFGYTGGILLVQPAPDPMSREETDDLLRQAMDAANDEEESPIGQAVTPYLLSKMAELSNGVTLDVNEELLIANAKLAAEVAGQLLL